MKNIAKKNSRRTRYKRQQENSALNANSTKVEKWNSSQKIPSIDMAGKMAHKFRATLVGKRDLLTKAGKINEVSTTKTSIFPLDIAKDEFNTNPALSLDKLAHYNFVLNGCTPGSLISAILNVQVQGLSLFEKKDTATAASSLAGAQSTGGSVAFTRKSIYPEIIEDATVAGMLVISALFQDSIWQKYNVEGPKKQTDKYDKYAKTLEAVDVTVQNALSWLLNTDGIALMRELTPSITFLELPMAQNYRAHIQGKLSSWSSNYKSSVVDLIRSSNDFLNEAMSWNLENAPLNEDALNSLRAVIAVMAEIKTLAEIAIGRVPNKCLSFEEANKLIQLSEIEYFEVKKQYEEEVRNSFKVYKSHLKASGVKNKELIVKMNEVHNKYYLPKIKKIKKIGGPVLNVLDQVELKQAELIEKVDMFNKLYGSIPSISDIKTVLKEKDLSYVLDADPKSRSSTHSSDEHRFRRQLDDLVRTSFGNHLLNTRIYPIIESVLGGNIESKRKFLNEFIFGVVTKNGSKRQTCKLVYSHTEQDIEPYKAFNCGTTFETEISTLQALEAILIKFEARLPRILNSFVENNKQAETNLAYSALYQLKVRVFSWKASVIAETYARCEALDEEEYSTMKTLRLTRVEIGRLFVDIQNALAELNPTAGKIAYSLSFPSAIGEAEKLIQIVPKNNLDWKIPKSLMNQMIFDQKDSVNLVDGFAKWLPTYTKSYNKIAKNKLYEPPPKFEEKEGEDAEEREKRLKAHAKKMNSVMSPVQKQIVDLMWKIPHDIQMGLPAFLGNNRSYRIKGVCSQKTGLAKRIARNQKISDGLYVIKLELSLGLSYDVKSKNFKFENTEKPVVTNITYNLPITEDVETLPNSQDVKQACNNLLAVDLNAHGLGVSLFKNVPLPDGKTTFERIELEVTEATDGTCKYFIKEGIQDGKEFKVFIEIPGLQLLKDRVGFYRKNAQKQRKFGSFIDPVLEQYRKTVVADVCKAIESLMVEYNVGFLAFENEVSNLETGEAQLRTLYKSIVNYYLWPENDARKSAKKAYWQGSSAVELIGENGVALKFHPGVGVRAAGTSQECSECGVNPMEVLQSSKKILINETEAKTPQGLVETHISLSYSNTEGDDGTVVEFIKIPVPEGNKDSTIRTKLFSKLVEGKTYDYKKIIGTELNEEQRRKLKGDFKKSFMRTELKDTTDSRSKQSKYVCYNPQCTCYLKERDADHNAANNIGARLIKKLGREPSFNEVFWSYLLENSTTEQYNKVLGLIQQTLKKGEEPKNNPYFNKTINLVPSATERDVLMIEQLLVEAEINEVGVAKHVNVVVAKPKK